MTWRIDLQLFAESRSEPASPRRRIDARRRGQVARTAELGTALGLIAAFVVIAALSRFIAGQAMAYTRWMIGERAAGEPLTEAVAYRLGVEAVWWAARIVGPVAGLVLLVGLLSQLVQIGFMATLDPLTPKLERINPLAGLKRIFSTRAIVELVKAMAKVAIVALISYQVIAANLAELLQLMQVGPAEALAAAGGITYRTGLWVAVVLLGIAVLDYGYQRWEFERSLRMSPRELRDEQRQTEGDPQLRQRIRQRQRQIAARRMMQAVPKADVVITNPTHLAIALRYDEKSMEAPQVVAKGAGHVAERIRSLAQSHGVPLVENPPLARALFETAELGQNVPRELYEGVAEVLAFVYHLKRSRGRLAPAEEKSRP